MQRYICIHGHFYQPPRENPWLEVIETQDSAAPYHDWNERITAECYATNGAARILDDAGRIARIVNNYGRISFNFGPTLLKWMERAAPDAYASVLAADRESQVRFSGHGSALAQAYHHAILPLGNSRDKRTEVRWGIRDFERRFGRAPEGMWLPEAAVDLESLEILAEEQIRFAVLAPYQAARARKLGESEWQDASSGRIDPTMAYIQQLPSGRSIALFFYDGPISRGVAFEGLLNRGEHFAGRLLGAFDPAKTTPQLVNIATDGETYGHHHRFGDMALAYALHYIDTNQLARLTNYGEFLELHPPTHEVEIRENTSWSCFHGIERWRSDCGCHTGGQPGWNQAWRAPLRAALDWLRDTILPDFERAAGQIFADPWAARDDYIEIEIERTPERIDAFLARHARPGITPDLATALRLMELQRHALLMYTSCGWFFSEISGIETVQVLQYAGRAMQLAQILFGVDLLPQFLSLLEQAPSNRPEYSSGADVYLKRVTPLIVDLPHVAAHYALASLFEDQGKQSELYAYRVERRDYRYFSTGQARLALGVVRVISHSTHISAQLVVGALHLGAQTLLAGVRAEPGGEDYNALVQALAPAFSRADLSEVLRLLNGYFEQLDYSLKSLFRDQQRELLRSILTETLAEVEEDYRTVYIEHAPLMRFLTGLDIPLPAEFQTAGTFTLSAALRRALQNDEQSIEPIRAILEEARLTGVQLDTRSASHVIHQTLDRLGGLFRAQPGELRKLQRFTAAVEVARALPFHPDLWGAQNVYHHVQQEAAPELRERATQETKARRWVEQFDELGEKLQFRVEMG